MRHESVAPLLSRKQRNVLTTELNGKEVPYELSPKSKCDPYRTGSFWDHFRAMALLFIKLTGGTGGGC